MIECGWCHKKFTSWEDWQIHMFRSHKEMLSEENIQCLKDDGIIKWVKKE